MEIESLEKERISVKNNLIILYIILSVVGIVLFLFLSILVFPFIIVLFVIGILMTNIISKKYKMMYKNTFVHGVLSKYFNNLVYKPNEGLSESVIYNTKMMNTFDRYNSEDYISASYKDIKFIQSNVHIEQMQVTTDGNGHTRTSYVTIFLGSWMIFEFNKEFKSKLQVVEKGFSGAINNSLFEKKYKRVEFEDIEFNKSFNVYATSEHEAFYILTPSFIEKIKKLNELVRGSIILCFIDNSLHFGLNSSKDTFEPKIFRKINEDDVIHDLKVITHFIDELDLDNTLFKK